MKKLKLNLQQMNNVEVLTRSQLRNVLGGKVPATSPSGCGPAFNACGSLGQLFCCSGLTCTNEVLGAGSPSGGVTGSENGDGGVDYWICIQNN